MNQPKGFASVFLIVIIVLVLGVVGYLSFLKKPPEVSKQTNTATQARTSVKEWQELTARIRAMKSVLEDRTWISPPEKGVLLDQYVEISDGSLSVVILDALPDETDPVLRDHHIFLLKRIINADGVHHLVNLIDEAQENPPRQELLLKVLENVSSPLAMPTLREIARSQEFTFAEPLLFFALRSIARWGGEEDIRALFDRVNAEAPGDRQTLSIIVTAAVETRNPEALPFLLGVASGINGENSKDAQLIAIYTLRNYRDDPEAKRLLNDLVHSSDKDVASAASEAL